MKRKIILTLSIVLLVVSCFNKKEETKKDDTAQTLEQQNIGTGSAADSNIFNLGQNNGENENKLTNLTVEEQKFLIENKIDPQKVSEAIKNAEQGDKEAIMSLSQLYYELKDKEKVKKYLQIGVDKNYPEAIYNLAVLYKEEGNTKKANELVARLPQNTNINMPAGAEEYNKGIELLKNKKYTEAKAQFEKAYAKGIKDADIRIALINKELKNTNEAIKWFKLAGSRGLKGIDYEIGALLYDSGKSKEARPYLQKAYNSGAKDLAMPIAISFHKENNMTEALKWYKIAAANGNKDAKATVAEIESINKSNASNSTKTQGNNSFFGSGSGNSLTQITINSSKDSKNSNNNNNNNNNTTDKTTTTATSKTNTVKTETNIPTTRRKNQVVSEAKEKNSYNVDIDEITKGR